MIKLGQSTNSADVRLSKHELSLINNALNEVCNGADIEDAEFATRLGTEREEMRNLLKNIASLIR
jgi:hypothetical protein